MASCSSCGKSLGIRGALMHQTMCADCVAKKDQQDDADVATYKRTAAAAAVTGSAESLRALREMEGKSPLVMGQAMKLRADAIRDLLSSVLADGALTEAEEMQVDAAVTVLDVPRTTYGAILNERQDDFVIGRINAGRVMTIPSPQIILKKGEEAYSQAAATLFKEVVTREFRGGSRGVSVPVGHGVRVRAGAFRGHSVVTGSHMQPQDSGNLTVTNQRVTFAGTKRSIEIPYAKLMNMTGFSDGVQFHLSSRVEAPLFRVEHPAMILATINYALEHR